MVRNLLKSSLTREHILAPAFDLLCKTGQSVGRIEMSPTDFAKVWDSNISEIIHTIEEVVPIKITPSEKVLDGNIILKPRFKRYDKSVQNLICEGTGVKPDFDNTFILTGRRDSAFLPNEFYPDILFDKDTPSGGLAFKKQLEYRIPIYKILVSDQIKSNLLIKVKSRHKFCEEECSNAELKAQNTLRDMISEADWRRYITNGFVIVKGTSGKWYQIFKEQKHIKVYNKGKKINEICIHTDKSCPRTDHVINMMFLIEHDELNFWNMGNVYRGESVG